ncbi:MULTISPECIES: ornithine cyclodeaminase family protein [unclassified Streptomyces]|uniref:ornithine cyclodeaminase family protein n=1 Tax=unclassified Streptomyces TaxID=2593676 RepID=UPI00247676DF|nr:MULTISPECIES: ornithine cyclodeaminase family protein [unclassified Streptomyces]MDH6454423.1 ornithine cyclodeaminase/alanine dehydrogenase-like protein (mu-crystallin family) [Streptomyces sp. SAI-119]MDH6495018.1 ornithine cyclodeaminase/alanine dehydrogenase-like protein (mu-crystallin family) [Streptomyces sp. SAI-149]
MTLLLTRGDLETVLEPQVCVDALRDGFRTADSVSIAGQRVRTDLPFPGTATALIPGLLPGVPAYTVKVNAKFPAARSALRGVICLHSSTDGELLALLDSATVTAWRTGLAAALGTHLLAGRGEVVGVIGAGAQAEVMARGLAALRPRGELVVHDTSAERAAAFGVRHGGRVLSAAAEVAGAADIVLTATWSREPLLSLADTRPGQHFTSLGADEPGKRELAADLLDASVVVVDDRALAMRMGVLAGDGTEAASLGETATVGEAATPSEVVAVGEAATPAGAASLGEAVTLGEVVRGEHPGRRSATERTVYAPVGLPWQDLAVAWAAYRRAEREGVGRRVDLLA